LGISLAESNRSVLVSTDVEGGDGFAVGSLIASSFFFFFFFAVTAGSLGGNYMLFSAGGGASNSFIGGRSDSILGGGEAKLGTRASFLLFFVFLLMLKAALPYGLSLSGF
jgi:hypothetical protein